MKNNMLKYLITPTLAATIFYNCDSRDANNSHYTPQEVAKLSLKEISGLEYVNNTLWGIEDSGNKSNIYKINTKTGTHEAFAVNATNTDWEDITSDNKGNLYIADTGNNDNDRRSLSILKINPENPATVLQTTTFFYPEQTDFPAKKKDRNFDCEGMFEYNGYFYLFSKNRSFDADGTVLIHKVPNRPGNFPAEAAGSFVTCKNFRSCAIAGADISPDGKTVALISGDKLWLLTGYTGDDFATGKLTSYGLGEVTQKESICYKDATSLYIADEKSKKIGGKLYTLTLK
ncbi:MAG: hypothetical protein ACLGH8_02920 [Bacteroidia bacterium]